MDLKTKSQLLHTPKRSGNVSECSPYCPIQSEYLKTVKVYGFLIESLTANHSMCKKNSKIYHDIYMQSTGEIRC